MQAPEDDDDEWTSDYDTMVQRPRDPAGVAPRELTAHHDTMTAAVGGTAVQRPRDWRCNLGWVAHREARGRQATTGNTNRDDLEQLLHMARTLCLREDAPPGPSDE